MAGGDKKGVELEPLEDRDREKRLLRQVQRIESIEALEDAGKWREARQEYELLAAQTGWTGILRDRVQSLRQIERMPSPSTAFLAIYRRYRQGLDADASEQRSVAQDAFEQVSHDPAAGFLRAQAAYQLASLAWEWLDFPTAIRLYQQSLRDFPQSAKREETLLMLARCALLPETAAGRNPTAGRAALDQLAKEFLHSRFHDAALGLRGRLHYLNAEYSAAFWCYRAIGDSRSVETMLNEATGIAKRPYRVWLFAAYLRHLPKVQTYDEYGQAISAIDRTRYALDADDLARFAALLRKSPDLPGPYFYYRLYHTSLKPADLTALANLADQIVAQHPVTQFSPVVRVRLAEVYYRRRQYDKALRWATTAQQGSSTPYDRALYVQGAALHRLGRSREALTAFRLLLTRCSHSPLLHGAREETAILCESLGDLTGALEQYIALDYTADIAYLLDARMSLAEVETAYKRLRTGQHKFQSYNSHGRRSGGYNLHYRERELLTYTLGIRNLREGHWDTAERWFKQMKGKRLRIFSQGRADWGTHPSPDPLTAVRELRRLDAACTSAPNDSARAAALYKVATYYYSHGTLLLYNPLLWQEERAWDFGFFLPLNSMKGPDAAATHAYMYRHEVYARSLALCLEIAERYPKAPVAPQALYRAACSARYLANFNGWWRTENHTHNHWREAARLMHLCSIRYPKHPLAKEAAKYAHVFEQERKDSWDENARTDARPPASALYTIR